MHTLNLVAELRELPSQDGWARYETTGRATLVCPCGINTGWIPSRDAAATASEHVGGKTS